MTALNTQGRTMNDDYARQLYTEQLLRSQEAQRQATEWARRAREAVDMQIYWQQFYRYFDQQRGAALGPDASDQRSAGTPTARVRILFRSRPSHDDACDGSGTTTRVRPSVPEVILQKSRYSGGLGGSQVKPQSERSQQL